jgi:lipopolysaccharide export system protein LptA
MPQGAAPAAATVETRLPGLLQQDQPATITSDALDYGGTGKPLTYTGSASLAQGGTTIRGNRIRIDQERGDFVVTGNARAVILQDGGKAQEPIDGRAAEIRYTDAKRLVAYLSVPSTGPAATQVQVKGPDGNLLAKNIDLFLAAEGSSADRLEAYDNVTAFVGTKKATGARLTYHAASEQYDMRGAGTVPVHITDSGSCREMSGKTLTFFKSADRIIVDGNEEMRTQTKSGGTCPPPRPSSR